MVPHRAAALSAEEIRDVNTRYHDVAADHYDAKWGIDFGELGRDQVPAKLRKALGREPRQLRALARDRRRHRLLHAEPAARRADRRGDLHATSRRGCSQTLARQRRALGLDVSRPQPADAERLPFADESFDLVLGHAVLHHIPDLRARVRGVPARAAPGGTLAVRGRALALRRPPRARAQALRDGASRRSGAARSAPRRAPAARRRGDRRTRSSASSTCTPSRPASWRAPRAARASATCASAARSWSRTGSAGPTARSRRRADPSDVPWAWRQYAYRGYLLLQELDRRLLESRLPPAIFYNLLLSARKPRRSLEPPRTARAIVRGRRLDSQACPSRPPAAASRCSRWGSSRCRARACRCTSSRTATGDDRALPRGRAGRARARVRDRVAVRRGAQGGRLRVRDRAGARAHGRRPHEHPRARHAAVSAARAPGRPALPGGRGRVPRRRAADEERRRRGRREPRASSTASWSSRRPTATLDERRAARDGRLRAWPRRSSSAPTPSRSCSSCARRTRACACSRCCCAPRSSGSSSRARAGARALERQGPLRLSAPSALFRQAADLLGDLQHEQREFAQDLRLAGGVVAEAHRAVVRRARRSCSTEPGRGGSEVCSAAGRAGLPGSRAPARAAGRSVSACGGATPLQCTPPSSLTSSVSRACGVAPLRVHDEQVGGRDAAAAAERDVASAAGSDAAGARRDRRRALSASPHALTATPPRRGSPAPVSAPVAPQHGLHAAEEQVELAEAHDLRRPRRRRARRGRCRARRRPRRPRSARAARRTAARASRPWSTDADDRLQDRRADAVGAGAAEHELDLAVAQHDRRRHHARHPPPGRMAVKAERVEVLLAHHVVEVDAGAGHDDARALAVGARHAARAAVGVEHRDVRRRAEPAAEEALEEARLAEPLEELRRALALGGAPSPRRRRAAPAATGSRSSSASA